MNLLRCRDGHGPLPHPGFLRAGTRRRQSRSGCLGPDQDRGLPALASDRDKNTYSNWRTRKTIPRLSDIEEIAAALNVAPADLLRPSDGQATARWGSNFNFPSSRIQWGQNWNWNAPRSVSF